MNKMSPLNNNAKNNSLHFPHHSHHLSEEEMRRTFLDRISNLGEEVRNRGEGKEESIDERKLLAQREKDLILAAELGKALLEKNAEISQENEKITEDYSLQLEHLEQEKYRLKRQIEIMEDEYEQQMLELQTDLKNYKRSLEEADIRSKASEKEKTDIINQLKEQNQHLTLELQLSSQRQEDLENKLSSLKTQFNDKRLSMKDDVIYLESLKSEIDLVTRRKKELEKQIALLFRERESLSIALEKSTERVLLMERKTREQSNMIRNSQRDINQLTASNQNLAERLESLTRSYSSSGRSSVNVSIMNEIMELSSTESEGAQKRSCPQIEEEIVEDDRFIDEDITLKSSCLEDDDDDEYNKQLRDELTSAYKQIKTLCGQIRESGTTSWNCPCNGKDSLGSSSNSSEDLDYKTGYLEVAVSELNELIIRDLLASKDEEENSNDKEEKMEVEIHKREELSEKNRKDLVVYERDLKIKEQDIIILRNQLSLVELRLASAEEEKLNIQNDLSSAHLSKDKLIKNAWEVRDDAVKKKNEAEVCLARERINLMQINSQLMEAVKQKVEIAQRLDQWQNDMALLLDEQLREKLKEERCQGAAESDDSGCPNSGRSSRILNFFKDTLSK